MQEVLSDPLTVLKADCPIAAPKLVTPFTLQTASNPLMDTKRDLAADCKEILERINRFVKANNICMAEWLQAFNADKSSLIKPDEFSRVLSKLNIPVSKLDQRQLFAHLAGNREELPISDLLKAIAQPKGEESPKPTAQENDNGFANSLIKLEQQLQRSPPENQKPKRPEGSKINELKRKIEFMQRSCKTTEKQSVLEMPVQRKISQERATQTGAE